jgi:hypothetical protein
VACGVDVVVVVVSAMRRRCCVGDVRSWWLRELWCELLLVVRELVVVMT